MFNLRAIRKSLPSGHAGRRCKANGSTRRSVLRGAIATDALHRQEEDELVAALSRSAALRMQRVSMDPDESTACILLLPEHLPLPVGARVHFHLHSERIAPRESRSSLVVASIGSLGKRTDRPLVVTSRADPAGGACEVVVVNSGDEAILKAFSIRFTIFHSTSTAGQAIHSLEQAQMGAWVLRDGVRWYGCASCRRRKPQHAFSRQNPATGRRNYRQTMQCDDCAGSSQSAKPSGLAAMSLAARPLQSQQQSEEDLEAIEIASLFGGEPLP